MSLSVVVLAGGRSQRMGRCKALMPFRGRPLVSWTVGALSELSDDIVVVVSGDMEGRIRTALPGWVRVVGDIQADMGPVAGLQAGLLSAKGSWVAVAPCDSPLSCVEFYRILVREARGYEGAVPLFRRYLEPLHSVYLKRAMLHSIEKVLARFGARTRGGHTPGPACAPRSDRRHSPKGASVRDVLGLMRIRKVPSRKMVPADPELRTFWNLSTPEDVRRAERSAPV